ncbi:MAG: polysaccharide deacetylase family protein, partial [Candidatus Acidiferrales bacterium]
AQNRVQNNLPATFFVQTHAPFRGDNPVGQGLITAEGTAGHHVEVHTGSDEDHALHTDRVLEPPYDANEDGVVDALDGQNGLESDLIRAKARIFALTGRTPLLVRPPVGLTNPAVETSYANVGLTMQLWDVDSGDTIPCGDDLPCVLNKVRTDIQDFIDNGQFSQVFLGHDVKQVTADNLGTILKGIEDAIQHRGRNVVFRQF